MVLLTMTPLMVKTINERKVAGSSLDTRPGQAKLTDEPSLEEPAVGKPISHSQVIEMAKVISGHRHTSHELDADTSQESHTGVVRLEELLRGSKVYVPPPKPKAEPTTEYKALMAKLRQEEEQRLYDRMLQAPSALQNHRTLAMADHPADNDDDDITYADVNRQLALIINILVSIVACSVAIWIASSHWSTPKRLGLSLAGSAIVGVAEVVVYAGYLRRVKEAKERGRKKTETKEIIKTWIISRDKLD